MRAGLRMSPGIARRSACSFQRFALSPAQPRAAPSRDDFRPATCWLSAGRDVHRPAPRPSTARGCGPISDRGNQRAGTRPARPVKPASRCQGAAVLLSASAWSQGAAFAQPSPAPPPGARYTVASLIGDLLLRRYSATPGEGRPWHLDAAVSCRLGYRPTAWLASASSAMGISVTGRGPRQRLPWAAPRCSSAG